MYIFIVRVYVNVRECVHVFGVKGCRPLSSVSCHYWAVLVGI